MRCKRVLQALYTGRCLHSKEFWLMIILSPICSQSFSVFQASKLPEHLHFYGPRGLCSGRAYAIYTTMPNFLQLGTALLSMTRVVYLLLATARTTFPRPVTFVSLWNIFCKMRCCWRGQCQSVQRLVLSLTVYSKDTTLRKLHGFEQRSMWSDGKVCGHWNMSHNVSLNGQAIMNTPRYVPRCYVHK